MTARVGIIAEDDSDVDVVRAIIGLHVKGIGIDKAVGKGCGKIQGKCRAWATDLKARGCNRLILLHDLDDKVLAALKTALTQALGNSPIQSHVIVVPVREIEAWLLADHNAIKTGLKLKNNIKMVSNPESINRPKEHLRDLIFKASEKKLRYLNRTHNKKIAAACSLASLRRCQSFIPLDNFIANHIV